MRNKPGRIVKAGSQKRHRSENMKNTAKERKVYDGEIEIISFVVNGSVQLTILSNRQYKI